MNTTQIPIDELYDQLTLILQEEKYAKSTIQLYQEHVKRIKKFMLANNITDYSSSVANQYYKKEVESRDYNYTTKRFFRTVIRRLNDICSGAGFVYSVPRKDLSVPEQYHAIKCFRTLHGTRNQNSTDGLSVNRSSCIHKRLCIFKIMRPLFRNIVFCCLICCKKTYGSLWY